MLRILVTHSRRIYRRFATHTRFMRYLAHHPRMLPAALRLFTGTERYARKYFNKKNLVAGKPISVTLRVTNQCNLRCIQCGQWGLRGVYKDMPKEEVERELKTEELIAFIKAVAWFRPYVSFFGGEPLLRDDIGRLIKYADGRNLLTGLTTNGILLAKKADELVDSGLVFIKVSLDGPRDINEQIRIGRNAYEQTYDGIKQLIHIRNQRKSLTPIVQLCTTVTKENQHKILDTAKIADALGVDIFAVLFGIFTTPQLIAATNEIFKNEFDMESRYWQGFMLDRSGMDIAEIERQVEVLKKSKQWHFRYRQYPAQTASFDIQTHYNKPEQTHGGGLCITPWFNMQLMPNGNIALCEDTPDYVAGNILQEEPLSIWNNQRYRLFRKHILEQGIFPVCTRCSALYENAHYLNDTLSPLRFDGVK